VLHAYREAEPIDRFVENVVLAYLSRADIAARLAPPESTEEAANILSQLASIRQRSDGLVMAFTDGSITQQQLREGQTRLERHRTELQERLRVPTGSVLRRLLNTPSGVVTK
jgi:hypothetical protein